MFIYLRNRPERVRSKVDGLGSKWTVPVGLTGRSKRLKVDGPEKFKVDGPKIKKWMVQKTTRRSNGRKLDGREG